MTRKVETVNYIRAGWIVAACLVFVGCGQTKKPDQHILAIHHATASVLAKHINGAVEAPGDVLLVHRQGSQDIVHSWRAGLREGLDDRFGLVEYGLDELSQEAARSLAGAVPVAEGMQAHPDAAVVIAAIGVDPEDFDTLPNEGKAVFALEWPYLDVAGPLLSQGKVLGGIFEKENRDLSAKPGRGASDEEVMSSRYLLATPEDWEELVGK